MECGIIGLPGCGKTSLFNALTRGHADVTAGAVRPNVGVAEIPDPRLGVIASHVETRKITPATITFVDIPGFDTGGGAARTGPILDHIRQVDAICHVVKCFATAGEPIDPARAISALEDELILADLALAESALDKARRPARAGDAQSKARAAVLERVVEVLGEGRPVRSVEDWSEAQRAILKGYGLLSATGVLYVANVAEDDLAGASEAARRVAEHAASHGGQSVALCAKLEAELAELEGADQAEMLQGLGLTEPAIGPLARAACRLLSLAVFYTAGPKEVRAWTVAEAATAPEAAAVIHTDLQRGFIRAECYSVDDLVQLKSEKAIKAAGKLRVEGKSYHIQDGDVVHVLFNV